MNNAYKMCPLKNSKCNEEKKKEVINYDMFQMSLNKAYLFSI